MLEWLLRKTFRIEKPSSRRKKKGADKQAEATTEERIEPSLGDVGGDPVAGSTAQTAATGHVGNAGAAQQHAPQAAQQAAPQQTAPQQAAPQGPDNVNIFHFGAWFKADPVKAALTLGLAFLSWLATYTGMLELIQANTGSLDVGSRIAIAFAVMMLMLMILYLLDSLYSGSTPNWLKPVFIFGYLFLTLISVGFGFGFYWKYLEAQTEATRSAESAVSQVQVSLQLGQTRLEQLQNTFGQLAVLSKSKAEQEREKGNTCPNSRPGEGPRMRLRDEDSQKFGYAAEYITGRAGGVKGDLDALNVDLQKVVSRDATTVGADGTRNEFLRGLSRKLDLTIARFNALATDPQIKQFRETMDKRAGTTVFPNGRGGTFRCPDTQLQTALRGVVRAIDDIPEIKNPKIAAVEGSEAIVEAFRRLAVTLAALPTLKLPPSPDDLRKQRKQTLSSGKANAEVSNIEPGLSKRDYIPLSAAVFVDLCILLISLNRRYNNFDKFQRSVASAEAGEIGNTMLEIFDAHQNEFSQEMLEIFHHAEFEYGSDYYMAVPLIKGSKQALYHERLSEKDRSITRSKHETLQERISVYELELQRRLADQMEAERTKRQITDFMNSLSNNRSRMLQAQKQMLLLNKQQPKTSMVIEQVDKVSDDIRSLDGQLIDFSKKLESSKRLLSGTNELVQQTRKEISSLKHKQTLLHEEEKGQIRKQVEVQSELDMAKEARFLSNLCVSLEANDILHLANIWPFQWQVRKQLKRHKSRYYDPEGNYRVYRFRKVADTQSQMVLDLIMEAAKRSRKNGELSEELVPEVQRASNFDEQGDFNPDEGVRDERLELERQKHDLALAREALEGEMASFRQDLASMNEKLNERPEPQPTQSTADPAAQQPQARQFQRDPNVEDAKIIDPQRLRSAANEGSKRVRDTVAAGIGSTGLGVPVDELAAFIKTEVERQTRETNPPAETVEVASDPEPEPELPEVDVSSAQAELAEEPVTEMEETVIPAEPVVEPTPEPVDPRDQVNLDSIPMPGHAERDMPQIQEPANDTEPVAEEAVAEEAFLDSSATFSDGSEVEAEVEQTAASEPEENLTPHNKALRESISGRLQKLNEQAGQDRGYKSAVYEDMQRVEPQLDVVETPAEPAVTKVLTEPVVVETVHELNQDPGEMQGGAVEQTELPSEADQFEEGALPGFLTEEAIMDDITEENRARKMAERFRPNTEEK